MEVGMLILTDKELQVSARLLFVYLSTKPGHLTDVEIARRLGIDRATVAAGKKALASHGYMKEIL
jgi:DNA-binding CsgD family transcriptional regulator